MKKSKISKKKINSIIISTCLALILIIISYFNNQNSNNTNTANLLVVNKNSNIEINVNNLKDIPEYSGNICIDINNNQPFFEDSEITANVFETYSNLDQLGRCGVAYANICKDIMPQEGEKRGKISYKPTGWAQNIYDGGKALYNRCHLIAWQLGNENNNVNNLITGTRQMNEAMIPYENMVADWIKNQNKEGKDYHVLYRVTPDFKNNNLLVNGVQIEAKSVEDNGEGICFNKYIYNIQEGFEINYKTGENKQI